MVDVPSLSIKVAIGSPDIDPEACQNIFTRDRTNNKFTGTLNINTTEMVAALTAASGNTIEHSKSGDYNYVRFKARSGVILPRGRI